VFGNFSWLPTARSADGDRLQRAPRFTYTVGVRGSTDLSPEFKLSGIASLLHSSSFLHQPASAPGDNASLPYTLLNARLELTYTPANLSMYTSAANLTNETYRTFMFGSLLNLGQVGAYNELRTITVGRGSISKPHLHVFPQLQVGQYTIGRPTFFRKHLYPLYFTSEKWRN
jgi:hypothetical protein